MDAIDAEIAKNGAKANLEERLPGSKPAKHAKKKSNSSSKKEKAVVEAATPKAAAPSTTATKVKAVEPTTAAKVKAVEPTSKVLGEEITDETGHKHKLHMSKPKHHKKKH